MRETANVDKEKKVFNNVRTFFSRNSTVWRNNCLQKKSEREVSIKNALTKLQFAAAEVQKGEW